MARADFNDYVYFAEMVAHGDFAAAGRALREPKSKLSRRVSAIGARLGLRLIERSSRQFRVTEVGQVFYEHCRAMMREAERAEALVAEVQAEPCGRVRVSCPTGMLETVSPALRGFVARYPKVSLQVVASNRAIDLIEKRVDVALRVRRKFTGDRSLTTRSLGHSRWILVASPQVASRLGADIASLAAVPTLGTSEDPGEAEWRFEREDGATFRLRHEPRLTCSDFTLLCRAAVDGIDVAYLPRHVCAGHLASGGLVHVLRDWRSQAGIIYLVSTTRRGPPLAVRALIEHLVEASAKL